MEIWRLEDLEIRRFGDLEIGRFEDLEIRRFEDFSEENVKEKGGNRFGGYFTGNNEDWD